MKHDRPHYPLPHIPAKHGRHHRQPPAGSLFIALRGETFDGNAFAAQALKDGCACAVVDNPQYLPEGDPRYLLVDDCLKALQQLARHHRRALGTPVIGITGTSWHATIAARWARPSSASPAPTARPRPRN